MASTKKPPFRHNPRAESDFLLRTYEWLANEFKGERFRKVCDLKVSYALSEEPIPFQEIGRRHFEPLAIGEKWATHVFQCAWFRIEGNAAGIKDPYLGINFRGEGLLIDEHGHALKGFSNGDNAWQLGNITFEKCFAPIAPLLKPDGSFVLYMDVAANHLQGGFFDPTYLEYCGLFTHDEKTEEIYQDFQIPYWYCRYKIEHHEALPHQKEFLRGMAMVKSYYQYHDPKAYEKSKPVLNDLIRLSGQDNFHYIAEGHSHLDLLWLWPFRETKRKILRTFSNAVFLCQRYPDYRYVASSPLQFALLEELDPKLFQQVARLIQTGQIEYEGQTWVENDINLPSEESWTHQALYGQKYWKEKFGSYAKIQWLPDTFGYAASLPQVIAASGSPYFLTQKLSWNEHTIFPYHTFRWIGIDGTSVLVHMPPSNEYNSSAGPDSLLRGEANAKHEGNENQGLLLFGIGDGGCGPSIDHVERVRRETNVPYLPKVKMGRSDVFFESISAKPFPTFQGELYLEKHQGTLTSQSNTKQNNRLFEERAKALEFYYASQGKSGDALKPLWKEAMLYQFHDCLPGSSIERVYQETDIAYTRLFEELEDLASQENLSFIPHPSKPLINHFAYPVSLTAKQKDCYLLYEAEAQQLAFPKRYFLSGEGDARHYENRFFEVSFDNHGFISALQEKKTGRVVLKNSNVLRVFIDKGDAWDFPDDYRAQPEMDMHLLSQSAKNYGIIHEIVSEYSFRNSRLIQTILLRDDCPYLDVTHEVYWKDTGYMLRAEFIPCEYAHFVTSDIQFGMLRRSTQRENEHIAAMKEIACQKWFDMSKNGAGIAIFNHTKNGFFAKDGILSLALLRSTDYPCPHSDQKKTVYHYAIYPHAGDLNAVEVDNLAMAYNGQFLFGNADEELPFIDNPAIEISAFAPAYNNDGQILRLYEKTGLSQTVNLSLPACYALKEETNLLEDKIGDVPKGCLSFHPYQIRTFRMERKK